MIVVGWGTTADAEPVETITFLSYGHSLLRLEIAE